jgi:hypothetical protein
MARRAIRAIIGMRSKAHGGDRGTAMPVLASITPASIAVRRAAGGDIGKFGGRQRRTRDGRRPTKLARNQKN